MARNRKAESPIMKRFQVTEAGMDDWKDVDAPDSSRAGEVWAEACWKPVHGEKTYELDVKDPSGALIAVTVTVSVDVTFSGFSSKHPCEEVA